MEDGGEKLNEIVKTLLRIEELKEDIAEIEKRIVRKMSESKNSQTKK